MVNKNNMFYIMVLIVFILNRDDKELGFEYFSTQPDPNSKSSEISEFIWGRIGFNFLKLLGFEKALSFTFRCSNLT